MTHVCVRATYQQLNLSTDHPCAQGSQMRGWACGLEQTPAQREGPADKEKKKTEKSEKRGHRCSRRDAKEG